MATRAAAKITASYVLHRSLLAKTIPAARSALARFGPLSPTASHSRRDVRWYSDKNVNDEVGKEAAPPEGFEATSPFARDEEGATADQSPPIPPPPAGGEADGLHSAQIKELKDALLRSLAEQENTRRIAHRDVDQARQFAIKSFAKSLLDVSDNLERAMAAVPTDMNKEDHAILSNLYDGIALTERGLVKAFESHGLVKFGAVGERFDPNLHEALFEYPDPAQTPGTVGQVMKAGYLLNKRVLRPAEVGVVKKQE